MDDQRTIVQGQHPDLDQAACPVGAKEQRDVVVIRVGGDGDKVAQGMADVIVGDVMAVGTGSDWRLPELHCVSIP